MNFKLCFAKISEIKSQKSQKKFVKKLRQVDVTSYTAKTEIN